MSRFLRLALPVCLFAAFVTLLLSPQLGHAVIPPPGDPAYNQDCPSGSPCVRPPQHLAAYSFVVSLTEGNIAEEYSVARVRSAFGSTLDFSLTYNSYAADGSRTMFMGPGSQTDIGLGYGWTHMYNDMLFTWKGDMFRMGPDGRVTHFALQSDGTYQTSPGYFLTLIKNNDGSFDLTTKYHTDYHYESIPDTPFQIDGPVLRVTSITDRNNNVTTLTYSNGDLTLITDTYGRSLQLAYNGNHHLTSVTDPAGATTTLAYNAAGNLLSSITDPDTKTSTYTYNNLSQIISKTDRDGRLFTILYQHKLPYSEVDSNGGTVFALTNPSNWGINPVQLGSFMRVYIPSTTSRTDGRGNVWQYSYDGNAHPLTVVAPDGATTTYTYDPATLKVTSVQDANGHTTTYSYDTQGNMLTRTDANGNRTSYAYDSMFNQMISMTDPQGRITTYTIDSHGNRLTENDPLGGTRTWTYDAHGNVLTETDKDGNTTTYNYDPYGNRNQATDALGEVTKYTHDIMGNRLSMTDADGNTTAYQYDILYRLVLETNALGGTQQYFYDAESDKTRFIDENGHPTTYTYDQRQRLTSVTDALGGIVSYTYDANNNRLSTTDQNNHTTRYAYDVQNRVNLVTDALGDTTQYSYDPVGNLKSETDANGHTSTYQYDALNRRTQKTDALNEVTMWGYDLTGLPGCPVPPGPCSGPTLGSNLVTKQTDGNGKVIYYAYDGLDRLVVKVQKQNGTAYGIVPGVDAVTLYYYDPNSNRIKVTQPDGNSTAYFYDAANRQIQMVQVQTGDTTTTTYDAYGNTKTITSPNENVTALNYDALNRRIQQTDSDGPVGTWSYDPVGNVVSTTDGDGNPTSYSYDALNRRVTMTDALNNVTQYFYDPVSNLLRVLDRNGNPTTYTYDAINRRLTVTDAQPATTTFQYDPVGNLLATTDANNHVTAFGYDKVNRKVSETYPDLSNNTITWAYDQVGNVISRTDQKGQITAYTYSDLYFLLSRAYSPSGSADTFTYDLSGRALTAVRSNCLQGCFNWNETFAYDGADRLLQSVQYGQPISYQYNIPARTRTLTYPSGLNLTEQWDFRPQLLNVNDGGSTPIAQFAYDAANNVLTRGYRNGTVATYTYNPNNWTCSLTHNLGATLIVGFTYAYDNEGNKFYEQKLHELNDSEAYSYDSVYRLIDYQAGTLNGSPPPNCPANPLGIQTPITQTAYTLDKLGNWNSTNTNGNIQNRTHSPSNEIVSINENQVASDYNGNTTSYAGVTYSYDEENRLVQAVNPTTGIVLAWYEYDAFGRRASTITDFGQTFYYYDGWRTIEEQYGAVPIILGSKATLAPHPPTDYVFGNYPDEALTMTRDGQTYFYHQNALWSAFALTDSNGNGVEGYQYDVYGYQTVVLPGQDGILDFGDDDTFIPGGKSAVGSPFLFTEQRYDPETGFLYYKNRYNSAFFGRFMSRDPLDYAAGDMNLYAYVGNNPTKFTDPTGNAATDSVTVCNPCNCPPPGASGPCDICCFTYSKLPPMNPSQLIVNGFGPFSGAPSGKAQSPYQDTSSGQVTKAGSATYDVASGTASFADLDSWSFGSSQSGSFSPDGQVEAQEFRFVKNVDKAGPKLLEAVATGQHIPQTSLTCRKAGKEQQEYMKITLSDVLVSAYHVSGSGGRDIVPMEGGYINFGTTAAEYKEQKPDGTLGGTTKMEFNLKTMKATN